jgi:hypothetical protein
MPRMRTGYPPKRPHAPTRNEQTNALIRELNLESTHELTVLEVLSLGMRGRLPAVFTIEDAHKLITEYARKYPGTIRYDPCPVGRIRVVCLHTTSRAQRHWRT